ncbi:hypothetical protein BJX61DRAFT_157295 [Aspergillus egyptiacus]|nr:hypothetical protein BJX61DRAFT_157295 [Aspergillus egyptiacus]
MRQRGAGTRKIKEIDFGFSLFGPPAEESSQPAPQPTNGGQTAAPAPQLPSFDSPPPPSETATTAPPEAQAPASPTPVNPSSQEQPSQRTPGSARNKLPPRPSTFDIPADEDIELGRSVKRRRIDVSPSLRPQAESQDFEATPNGTVAEPSAPPPDEVATAPVRTSPGSNQDTLPDPEPPIEATSIPVVSPNENTPVAGEVDGALDVAPSEPAPPATSEPTRVNGTTSPVSDTTNNKRRGRKGHLSPSHGDDLNPDPTGKDGVRPVEPQESPEAPQEQVPSETELPEAPQEARLRSRTPAPVPPSAPSPPRDQAPIEGATSEQVPGDKATKGLRGRKRKTTEDREGSLRQEPIESATDLRGKEVGLNDAPAIVEPADASQDQSIPVEQGKKRAGRPKKVISQSPGPVEETSRASESRKHPEEAPQPAAEEETQPQRAPEPDSEVSRPHRGRKKREEVRVPVSERERPGPEPEAEAPRPSRRKRTKETGEAIQGQEEQAASESEIKASRSDRRKKREAKEQDHDGLLAPVSAQEKQPEAGIEPSRPGRKRKPREEGEQQPDRLQVSAGEPEERPAAEPAAGPSGPGRKRKQHGESTQERAGSQEPTARLEKQPAPEPSRADRKKRQRDNLQKSAPERQEQPEREREPEAEIEVEHAAEQVKAKSAKRRGKEPRTEPEQPAQDENATEERPRPTKRKPRQPQGETVPVTVHRLANATALGGELLRDDSDSDDDGTPADETADKQMVKLPSRGGVNAADVLAQICRETLEKTLSTLKNGIANETNAARRADWTLRKKAVEAFGGELEGRLFELSEMLDSNFMLGVKLKKAKRSLLERRTRLDQIRKEREAVALRMDAVRREHAKEEQAGIARSTINHSLHNLDLALERSHSRTTEEDERLTAGLEFRLRNMAQNVSSTAPGSQGGLLNQIKRFNAQLEATARQLEG